MTDKKSITFELKLYSAFVSGMMKFDKQAKEFIALNQQELVNLMHAEGRKYVINVMRSKDYEHTR